MAYAIYQGRCRDRILLSQRNHDRIPAPAGIALGHQGVGKGKGFRGPSGTGEGEDPLGLHPRLPVGFERAQRFIVAAG